MVQGTSRVNRSVLISMFTKVTLVPEFIGRNENLDLFERGKWYLPSSRSKVFRQSESKFILLEQQLVRSLVGVRGVNLVRHVLCQLGTGDWTRVDFPKSTRQLDRSGPVTSYLWWATSPCHSENDFSLLQQEIFPTHTCHVYGGVRRDMSTDYPLHPTVPDSRGPQVVVVGVDANEIGRTGSFQCVFKLFL